MKIPFSNAKKYVEQLISIEQKISQNQLEQAALQLNQLGKTAAHDPRIFLLGARLADAARNPDGMLQAARKAHQLAPQWPTASIYLSGVLAGRGEAEEAMSMAEQALQQATLQASVDVELLTQVAAIAQRFELHSHVLQWLRQAEQLSPGDVSIRYKIALTLNASGDPASAIGIFTDLLQQQPTSPILLSARMQACLNAQQTEQAILDGEALVAMEPANELYSFYLSMARGETPKTLPAALVVDLFDGFASRYERHWVVQLQYKLPWDVAQMISQWHPDRKGDILDLGCGTGLLGVGLGPIEGVLVGVDLSNEMIVQANRHHIYDSFHQVNVLDALQATPADQYHVISALDVFNYVGSLDSVVPNAYRILLPGGHFVFSCEAGVANDVGPGYALQSTYRYMHQRNYVQRLMKAAGFKEIVIEDNVLRYEAGQPVQGLLVTALKPIKAAGKTARRSPKNAKPVNPPQ
jgi:predicted TPR repeat methyltransferase